MLRPSILTRAGVVIAVALGVLGPVARAEESTGGTWGEMAGVEIGTYVLGLQEHMHDLKNAQPLAGPAITLRGATRLYGRLYWTTFLVGAGLVIDSREGLDGHIAVGTELGAVLYSSEGFELSAGLELAGGYLQRDEAIETVNGYDSVRSVGGYGLLLSPVFSGRYLLTENFNMGLAIRMLIPTIAADAYGTATVIALTVGVR